MTRPISTNTALINIDQQYDAVIVGAGWAGLKAAKTLLDEGITNILILEANNYIGGRSKTVNADGSINVPNPSDVSYNPVDLGSEWLYIEGNNMIHHLKREGYLDKLDLNDASFQNYFPMKDAPFYVQSQGDDGKVETKKLDQSVVKDLYERVWGGFESFRRELLRGT